MRARPPWTGWSRSRSGASPSPPPPRPASGSGTAPSTGSTSSIRRATWTSPSRWSARSACSTAPSPCSTPSPASSPRPRPSGARPTATACPASSSPTRWTGSAPTSTAASRMIRDRLTKKAYPIQLPVGSGEMFTGHIDVLRRVEIIFDDETLGKTFTEMPVPEAYRERVEAARHEVIEAAVEHDEELLEKYLGGAELSLRRDPARHPEGDDLRLDRAGAVRRLVQEQGRAGAARRGHRLPAEPDGHPADQGPPPAARRHPRRALRLGHRAVHARSRSRSRPTRTSAGSPSSGCTRARSRAAATSTTAPRTSGSGSAGCCRCTPTSGTRSRRCSPATSPRPSASRTPAPATRCPTRTSRSSSRR